MSIFPKSFVRTTIIEKKILFFLLWSLFLFYLKFFNYVKWNMTYAGWISYIIVINLVIYYLIYKRKFYRHKNEANFRHAVCVLMILPFFSMISCWMIYGQSPLDSFKALFPHFLWIMYYLLHIWKPSEGLLLRVVFFLAIMILLLQTIQQITYPVAFWGVPNEHEALIRALKGAGTDVEIRNGLYRFRVGSAGYFTMIIFFYAWCKLRIKRTNEVIFVVILMLVSIYLFLTRQILAATILTTFFFVFLGKSLKTKLISSFWILIGGGIFVYLYFDVLFGEFMESTVKEVGDSDNIRLLSAAFFLSKTISNPLLFLIGSGFPKDGTTYANYISTLTDDFGFYPDDVGFIGFMFFYGVIYILLYFYIVYLMLLSYRKNIPDYIKMFVVATGLMSVMVYPFSSPMYYLVWSIVLYICDLHINIKIKERK